MTASEAEGCFYWPAVGSSEMFPGRYRRRRRGRKILPQRFEQTLAEEEAKKRWKGGEK